MKNIYILPTSKPSRLWINNLLQGKLELSKEVLIGSNTAQNIYITSDEEIKEGHYGLIGNEVMSYHQMHKKWGMPQGKKIILTTDQDLIKDGVQAIDDEFLEWFVQNSSCEEVKVELHVGSLRRSDSKNTYKIIIPKEETNTEIQQKSLELTKEFVENNDLDEIMSEFDNLQGTKQETLEEFAIKIAQLFGTKDSFEYIKNSVKYGAKWQQEQDKKMYSEIEVLDLLVGILDANKCFVTFIDIKEWFEQNKNK